MKRDQRGSAVLVVIWMTGVLAVMALNFASRVREVSQEVRVAEARLEAEAAIDMQVAEIVYQQLEVRAEEAQANGEEVGTSRSAQAGEGGSQDRTPPLPAAGQASAAAEPEDDESSAPTATAADEQDPKADVLPTVQKPITKTVVVGDVSLYLHAEPEMGRIDVNRGDPRVVRALLEKLADRGTASRVTEVMRTTKERAQRIGAVAGEAPPPFLTVEAWMTAIGLDQTTANRVRPFVTTYTGATAVDLNYAPQEVIDILPFLSRSQKERIAKAREQSQLALQQVLAQIAEDPSTAQDQSETGSAEGESENGQATKQVMRITAEATVEGVLRRTERIILAFNEEGSGAAAGEAGDPEDPGGFAIGTQQEAQAAAPSSPFTILDRAILDLTPAAAAQAAALPKEEGL